MTTTVRAAARGLESISSGRGPLPAASAPVDVTSPELWQVYLAPRQVSAHMVSDLPAVVAHLPAIRVDPDLGMVTS